MGTRLISLENAGQFLIAYGGFPSVLKRRISSSTSDSTFVLARPKLTSRRLIYCIPHSDQKVLHQAVSSKDGTLLGRLNLSCTQSRTMRPGEKWTPPGSLKEGQPFPAVIHSV